MILLADQNIVAATEIFGRMGEVRCFDGDEMDRDILRGADALLVRSVTRVDEALLRGSRIRFVGSATIGTDHVDKAYLREAGIAFAHAPGSNADSVAEYVLAALLRICIRRRCGLRGLRIGIVGCGQIGGRLAGRLPHLGVETLMNDPPLAREAEQEGRSHCFLPLDDVLAHADAVTIHVPLVRRGPHPTIHLIGRAELRRMQPGSLLINTSRGPVVDNAALMRALSRAESPAHVVLDVWEGEPEPDAGLVRQVDLATPHIAGYAYDAKLRGTWMLYRALQRFLGDGDPGRTRSASNVSPSIRIGAPDPMLSEVEWLDQLVRRMYDIGRDDAGLRRLGRENRIDGTRFTALRREYPMRREFGAHVLPASAVPHNRRRGVELALGVVLR